MNVQLLFFAQLRDLAGLSSLTVELEANATVNSLLDYICSQYEHNAGLVNALQDTSLMVSVNQKVADRSIELDDGDEVGFLPPVSGG